MTKPASPTKYAIAPNGDVVAQTDEQAVAGLDNGYTPTDGDTYRRQLAAAAAEKHVDANWGTAGKAAAGVASGLTLGLAPSIASRMGWVDRDNLEAAEQSGAFQAGDIAGMVAPAVLTGGESLAARGLAQGGAKGLGKVALALTPAGLMGEAGGLAERLAGHVIESSSIMGKLAKPTLEMAARGAAEGAINNAAHTVADEVIQNKPLAAQAILASGIDGALFGGLTGGVLGGAMGAAGAGIELVGGRVAGGAGGTRDFARYMKHIGASEGDIASLATREGGVIERAAGVENGIQGTSKSLQDILSRGDGSVAAGPKSVYEASRASAEGYKLGIKEAIKEMDREAPSLVPKQERVLQRLRDTVENDFRGVEGIGAKRELQRIENLIRGEDVVKVPPKPPASNVPKTSPEWGDYYVAKAAHDAAPVTKAGGTSTWDQWAALRDSLQKSPNDFNKAALNIIDDEMVGQSSALMAANPELAKKYAANVVGARTAEEFASISKTSAFNPPGNPLNVGAAVGKGTWAMLVGANPIVAPAMIAGSQLMSRAKQAMSGPMAEAAYRSAIGGQAVKATVQMGQKMTSGVRAFLRGTSAAARGEHAEASSYTKPSYSVENYQKSLKLVDDLTSASHQQKVRETTELLAQQGHPEMAQEMAETYGRAVAYLQATRPKKGLEAHQAAKLGKLPKAMSLDTNDMKFMRRLHAMTQPMDAIMGGLERGDLSRDAVAAWQAVYPAAAQELNYRVAEEIMSYRSEGKYVPADKLAQLGTLLNAPVDSQLEKSFIDACQQGLAANKAPAPEPNAPQDAQTDVSSFQTPLQSTMS